MIEPLKIDIAAGVADCRTLAKMEPRIAARVDYLAEVLRDYTAAARREHAAGNGPDLRPHLANFVYKLAANLLAQVNEEWPGIGAEFRPSASPATPDDTPAEPERETFGEWALDWERNFARVRGRQDYLVEILVDLAGLYRRLNSLGARPDLRGPLADFVDALCENLVAHVNHAYPGVNGHVRLKQRNRIMNLKERGN